MKLSLYLAHRGKKSEGGSRMNKTVEDSTLLSPCEGPGHAVNYLNWKIHQIQEKNNGVYLSSQS